MLAAEEVVHGWSVHLGYPIALVFIYALWRWDKWRQNRAGVEGDPSPAEAGAPLPRETRRSDASHLTSHDGRPARETVDSQWWGAISYEPDGTGRRTYQRPVAYGEESPGDELDVALEIVSDSVADDVPDDVVDDYDEPGESARETAEEYAIRCFGEGVERAAIAKALQQHYGMARATAYRLLDRVERRPKV